MIEQPREEQTFLNMNSEDQYEGENKTLKDIKRINGTFERQHDVELNFKSYKLEQIKQIVLQSGSYS